MRRIFLTLSFLLICLTAGASQVVSNGDLTLYQNSSYDQDLRVSGVPFASYYALMYPAKTNYWRPVSRGGEGWQGWYLSEEQKWCLPFLADAGAQIRAIMDSDDNGNYTSNQVWLAGLDIASATNSFYNGTAATNEGYNFNIQWLFTGNLINDSVSGDGGAKARQNADTNLFARFNPTLPTFNQWSNLWVNGWNTDVTGNRVLGFSTGSHPYQGGTLASDIVRLQGIGAETNVASFIIDATALTAVTNNCAIVNANQNGPNLSFNIRYDRLPIGWIENAGTITNQGSMCFQAMPSLANWMTFAAQGTNFIAGHHYSLSISNVTVDTFTGAQFNAGRNWFTNMVGPIWAQRTNVVNAYLDLYGIDHDTLLSTHQSGAGILGVPDIIGFKSIASGFYDSSGHRGASYVSDMATTVQQLKAYDAAAYAAAQPITMQMVITDLDYVYPPRFIPARR